VHVFRELERFKEALHRLRNATRKRMSPDYPLPPLPSPSIHCSNVPEPINSCRGSLEEARWACPQKRMSRYAMDNNPALS